MELFHGPERPRRSVRARMLGRAGLLDVIGHGPGRARHPREALRIHLDVVRSTRAGGQARGELARVARTARIAQVHHLDPGTAQGACEPGPAAPLDAGCRMADAAAACRAGGLEQRHAVGPGRVTRQHARVAWVADVDHMQHSSANERLVRDEQDPVAHVHVLVLGIWKLEPADPSGVSRVGDVVDRDAADRRGVQEVPSRSYRDDSALGNVRTRLTPSETSAARASGGPRPSGVSAAAASRPTRRNLIHGARTRATLDQSEALRQHGRSSRRSRQSRRR